MIDLAETLITPAAFRAYREFAERALVALAEAGITVDPKAIPDEQGRVEADGSLTIFVEIPNVGEVSMSIPKGQWAWTRRRG